MEKYIIELEQIEWIELSLVNIVAALEHDTDKKRKPEITKYCSDIQLILQYIKTFNLKKNDNE